MLPHQVGIEAMQKTTSIETCLAAVTAHFNKVQSAGNIAAWKSYAASLHKNNQDPSTYGMLFSSAADFRVKIPAQIVAAQTAVLKGPSVNTPNARPSANAAAKAAQAAYRT